MDTQELLMKLELIHALKEQRSELDDQITALEDSVKGAMDEQGVTSLEIGERKAKYTRYFRNTFDTKAFKADHVELYDEYTKTVPATRFTVN